MALVSSIKGWFLPTSQPKNWLDEYAQTRKNKYLSRFVDEFHQPLYHYLLTQSDEVVAQDVIQSTWLKVIRQIGYYQVGSNAKSWLYRVARNTLIDELRYQQRWQHEAFDNNVKSHNVAASLEPQQQFDDGRLLDKFNQVLLSLPFHQREAFVLQQEGFSLQEIAEISDANKETVKTRIRYAKSTIKQYLESAK